MNTRNEVAKRVVSIVSDTLSVPASELGERTLVIEDLHATSMDVVTLMVALDDEFDIELNMDDLPADNVSVGWVIDYISGKLQ